MFRRNLWISFLFPCCPFDPQGVLRGCLLRFRQQVCVAVHGKDDAHKQEIDNAAVQAVSQERHIDAYREADTEVHRHIDNGFQDQDAAAGDAQQKAQTVALHQGDMQRPQEIGGDDPDDKKSDDQAEVGGQTDQHIVAPGAAEFADLPHGSAAEKRSAGELVPHQHGLVTRLSRIGGRIEHHPDALDLVFRQKQETAVKQQDIDRKSVV